MTLLESLPESPKSTSEPARSIRAADAVPSATLMSRTTLNFWLDAVLLGVFAALSAIGTILRFVFPPPSQSDGYLLWGFGYDQWSAAWFNLFVGFALLILFHVMLHWSWICSVGGRLASRALRRAVRVDEAVQTIYGVALLIFLLAIVGVVSAAAALAIQGPS